MWFCPILEIINGVLGNDSVLLRLYWAATTWTNEMNNVMKHAPGAGSIAGPVGQRFNALPLSYGCPLLFCKVFQCRNQNFKKKGESMVTWCFNIVCKTWRMEQYNPSTTTVYISETRIPSLLYPHGYLANIQAHYDPYSSIQGFAHKLTADTSSWEAMHTTDDIQ